MKPKAYGYLVYVPSQVDGRPEPQKFPADSDAPMRNVLQKTELNIAEINMTIGNLVLRYPYMGNVT